MAVPDCPALIPLWMKNRLSSNILKRATCIKTLEHSWKLNTGLCCQTEDQLRGRLKRLGLKRRGSESSLEEVKAAIQVSKN